MFKRILIVVEPHLDATAAIQTGAALAKTCDTEVVFFSGPQRLRAPLGELPDGELAAQWAALDDAQERAGRQLIQAKGVAESLGVMSRSVVARGDDSVRSIVDAAQAGRCDLIMLASDGNNAVVRLLTGNVIPGLITSSPVPVLVCASTLSPAEAGVGATMRRILVVLEDRGQAKSALKQALELAHGHAAELLLVHIIPPDVVPVVDISSFATESSEQLAAEVRVRSRRLLASASTLARNAGLTARGMGLPAGTTAKDIARLAVDQACDLVVVAHQGSNAVMRLLAGSLIPGLITAATVPILICREVQATPRRRAPRRRRHRHKAAAAAAAARAAHGPTP